MNSDKTKVLILCNDFPPVNSIGADGRIVGIIISANSIYMRNHNQKLDK